MRNVLVRFTTHAVIEMPDDFDDDDVEEHLNYSNHCLSQELIAIGVVASDEDGPCGCHCTTATVLRDATPQDRHLNFDLTTPPLDIED